VTQVSQNLFRRIVPLDRYDGILSEERERWVDCTNAWSTAFTELPPREPWEMWVLEVWQPSSNPGL
jgi:hypothetical protein